MRLPMFRKKDPVKRVFALDEKGELKWFTTINPQRFLAMMDLLSVVVGKRSDGASGADVYTLEIRDRGVTVACASSEATDSESESGRAHRDDDLRRNLERVHRHASETAVSDGFEKAIEKIDRLIAKSKMRRA